MRTRRSSWLLVAAVAGMMAVASCQPGAGGPMSPTSFPPAPAQRVCDGISSEVGGCEPRHSFAARTCSGLAEEWARELDRKITSIVRDPDQDPTQAASVLLRQALVVVTIDMNTRLRGLGLAGECDIPTFLAAAEPHFSVELKEGAGALLFDGNPPTTYQDWLDDVRKVLRMIEEE